MDRQETYDKVRDHLMNQGERSYIAGLGCRYRGPNGTMCAVGCLIPDDIYDDGCEGATVTGLTDREFEAIGVAGQDDIQFLRGLQRVHDESKDGDFAQGLYDFALENGLRP